MTQFPPDDITIAVALARWESFLGHVRAQWDELLRRTEDDCLAALVRSGFEPGPMLDRWSIGERQAEAIESTITDAWLGHVRSSLTQAGASVLLVAAERIKGEALRGLLEFERERARIRIYAETASEWLRRSPADDPHEKENSTMRLDEVFLHALCKNAALAEWLAKRSAEGSYRRTNPRDLTYLEAWERAEISYLQRYFSEQKRLLPHNAAAIDAELARKVDDVRAYVRREAARISPPVCEVSEASEGAISDR